MERTLVIIESGGVRHHLVESIIQRFEAEGLAIAEMKFETMTPELAKERYQHLIEHSFSDELIGYMTSGPVAYLVLVGKEVTDTVREMIGATKAVDTVSGTIQGDYALPGAESIIHASDSHDAAVKKIVRFFLPFDINKPSEKAVK